jgi:hypothetical protein
MQSTRKNISTAANAGRNRARLGRVPITLAQLLFAAAGGAYALPALAQEQAPAGDDGQHAYTAPPEHGRFHSAAYESDIKLTELVILCTRYMPSVNSPVDRSRRLLQPLHGRYASWFRDKIPIRRV